MFLLWLFQFYYSKGFIKIYYIKILKHKIRALRAAQLHPLGAVWKDPHYWIHVGGILQILTWCLNKNLINLIHIFLYFLFLQHQEAKFVNILYESFIDIYI